MSEPPNPLQGLKRKGINLYIQMKKRYESNAVGVFNTCTKSIYPELAKAAKKMRGNPTEAESVIWSRLSGTQLGYKFRRQHIIDRFVVDFFCLEKSLVVEIDGDIHDLTRKRDEERERMLKILGCRVMRFTNRQVKDDIESVIRRIIRELSL